MYTDVSRLFDLVEHYWKECRHGIGMPLDVWKGRRYELEQIRHRKAHCRRPHRDDVDRIEQTLRDLEPAASKTLRLYVDWTEVNPDLDDPVVRDWIGRDHEKSHLVEHGFKNKGIDFHLAVSARPWADREATIVSGTPGYWWVLWVVLHDQHMFIDDFVRESAVRSSLPLIGHIIQPSDHFLYVTFPSVGNATDISDAIARCFEAVFYATTYGVNDRPGVRHPWRRAELDPRVDAQGLLSVLSDLNLDDPISIFSSEKP
jgi:hypothetical protein